jgi:hypothetical protein
LDEKLYGPQRWLENMNRTLILLPAINFTELLQIILVSLFGRNANKENKLSGLSP